ncbi:hypothetical protein [Nannocystis sp.]|uniref:hypothetical protein n=1 Tax=Nannocystis sp. TaxID=1962667 RepID=UPI0025D70B69|nr:hypothetical protein [Nannocystis sp.]MBK7826191.1 hypothetical protein [Nannocystis sp.]
MTPPPSTPKRPRRTPPKIIGHTAPTPRVVGTTARSSLRSLAPTVARPGVRTPTGAPGMLGFPRARTTALTADRHVGPAVSVRKALSEQALADQVADQVADQASASPTPELLDPSRPSPGPRRKHKPGPARPTVRGRPTTPDEQPLAHAPAAGRPEEPPLRTTLARPQAPGAARDGEPAAHRAARRRTGHETRVAAPLRPRPSRVLAELHAALDEAAAAAE